MLVRRGFRRRRSGVTVVEMAIIYSVLFLVLFGLILGAIAVFRYQQVAQLAREGSRWAAVHGDNWATEKSMPPTTPQDVYDNAIGPRAVSMQPSKLSYAVTWDTSQKPYHTEVRGDDVVSVNNNVIVTVTYQWDEFMFGPVTLRSTSVSPMYY
ncbi:MAG TPA: TadE/TadG family type IV pilus assembly protein [Fimbriiglobus sp.]|nr:TadE/TadG family type IV pilus assembly protein [Fimbriiglobus sp.]